MTAIKQAVEYYKGVWPDFATRIYVFENGKITELKEHDVYCGSDQFHTVHKQQFEDYVREAKMEKQYKYVDAGIKTVGELVDRLIRLDVIFNGENQLYLEDFCGVVNKGLLNSYSIDDLQQILPELTIHQPIPWYEVEGVFDTPKWVKTGNGATYLVVSFDGNELVLSGDEGHLLPSCCKPLTPTEAAKYGVE